MDSPPKKPQPKQDPQEPPRITDLRDLFLLGKIRSAAWNSSDPLMGLHGAKVQTKVKVAKGRPK